MGRAKIKITLVDKKGTGICHYNHKIGDSFDFDTDRGKLCPMAMHVSFPYIDILRYGGSIPGQADKNQCLVSCPDVDILNIFKIEKIED